LNLFSKEEFEISNINACYLFINANLYFDILNRNDIHYLMGFKKVKLPRSVRS